MNIIKYYFILFILLLHAQFVFAQKNDSFFYKECIYIFYDYMYDNYFQKGTSDNIKRRELHDLLQTVNTSEILTGIFNQYRFFCLSYGYHGGKPFFIVFDSSGNLAKNISIDSFNISVKLSKHKFSNLEQCFFYILISNFFDFSISGYRYYYPYIYRKIEKEKIYNISIYNDIPSFFDTISSYLNASRKESIYVGLYRRRVYSILLFNFSNKSNNLLSIEHVFTKKIKLNGLEYLEDK